MASDASATLVERLLLDGGPSLAEQIEVDPIAPRGPELFEVLCVSLLTARRLEAWSGLAAWVGLRERGWSTTEALTLSPWRGRVRILKHAGYVRSAERISFSLGTVADSVTLSYDGNLGNLRDRAGHDPDEQRRLLTGIKGINDAVADVFFREVQVVWSEWFPFAGEDALAAAARLDLPRDPYELVRMSGRERFPQLVAALAHIARVDAYDAVQEDRWSEVDLREPARRSSL